MTDNDDDGATASTLATEDDGSYLPDWMWIPTTQTATTELRKRRQINLCLDQCESIRFPFKKKLLLNGLSLNKRDIPLADLCGTAFGDSLFKLSLAGNPLRSIPSELVQSLPMLKVLDLSQCELHELPEHWDLPKLARLNLSFNRLREFPEESILEGLPELVELNLYGNKVSEIVLPRNPALSKLETLDLGYNDLIFLPDNLDQLKSLRVLKVMNNFLSRVPMRVCVMSSLRYVDVSSNPLTEPPIETCERGICSMRRYWHCLQMEEQTKLNHQDTYFPSDSLVHKSSLL